MESGTIHGETLAVPERVIVAPAPGTFRPVEPGDIAPEVAGRAGAGHRLRGGQGPLHAGPLAVRRQAHGPARPRRRAGARGPARGLATLRPLTGLKVAIAGVGMAVPERRVTNFDLSQTVDTSDEWITERTGIKERRVAGDGETTASLAIEAGLAAIKDAGLDAADIGLCIVATVHVRAAHPADQLVRAGGPRPALRRLRHRRRLLGLRLRPGRRRLHGRHRRLRAGAGHRGRDAHPGRRPPRPVHGHPLRRRRRRRRPDRPATRPGCWPGTWAATAR